MALRSKTNRMIQLILFGIVLCILNHKMNYRVIPTPNDTASKYHSNILIINSIINGFALTNLVILLKISDDKIIKKLDGTDILKKRNDIIEKSIVFGMVSMCISLLWILKVNFGFIPIIIGRKCFLLVKEFLFYIEVMSFGISIFYFLMSVKKIMQLLNLIYTQFRKTLL